MRRLDELLATAAKELGAAPLAVAPAPPAKPHTAAVSPRRTRATANALAGAAASSLRLMAARQLAAAAPAGAPKPPPAPSRPPAAKPQPPGSRQWCPSRLLLSHHRPSRRQRPSRRRRPAAIGSHAAVGQAARGAQRAIGIQPAAAASAAAAARPDAAAQACAAAQGEAPAINKGCARRGDAGDSRVIDVGGVKVRNGTGCADDPCCNEGNATTSKGRPGDAGDRQRVGGGTPPAKPRNRAYGRGARKPCADCHVGVAPESLTRRH